MRQKTVVDGPLNVRLLRYIIASHDITAFMDGGQIGETRIFPTDKGARVDYHVRNPGVRGRDVLTMELEIPKYVPPREFQPKRYMDYKEAFGGYVPVSEIISYCRN